MSDDLVAFVRARLEEDERIASASAATGAGSNWTSDGFDVLGASRTVASCTSTGAAARFAADAAHGHVVPEHIARHDPGRVLREVSAKRRIIDLHQRTHDNVADRFGFTAPDMCAVDAETYPCSTVRLLALPYADHPDYRPEWSVTRPSDHHPA